MYNEMELTTALSNAIDNQFQGFELHYQPQLCSNTNGLKGLEALVRWTLPELGSVRPDIFIPLAERKGLIGAIGNWVLDTACLTSRIIRETTEHDINMSVNVSGVQLNDPGFLGMLCQTADRHQVDYQQLIIEVTETSFMEQNSHANEVLKSVREAGFGISIDDFGTGYASLDYIQRFNPSELKVDRIFVDKILDDEHCLSVVRLTLSLAKNLSARVVAEGVETQAQADRLKELGAPILQGYLLGKPTSFFNLQKTHLKPKQNH